MTLPRETSTRPDLEAPSPPAAAPPNAATVSPWLAALRCRCPRCGKGALFRSPVGLVPRSGCSVCGLDFTFIDSGDGPAVFAILILGAVGLGAVLVAEFKFGAPIYVHAVLLGVLLPAFALLLLRGLKAALVALQYSHVEHRAEAEPR